MIPGPDAQRIKAHVLIWWIFWASYLMGLVALYFIIVRDKPLPPASSADLLTSLVGFVPLFLSVVVRWLVLPRYTNPGRALVIFIFGMAMAETCGILAILFGGPYRDALFLLGVLGITQYVPMYARKLYEPKATGFIPNN